MKVVIDVPVSEAQHERIREAAGGGAEVVLATGREALHRQVRDATVIFGRFDQALFARAPHLRWVQTLGAGVDGVLFPDFVASDIVLTSEKGHVGPHLAEHAFALLLAITRGVARAVRERIRTKRTGTAPR